MLLLLDNCEHVLPACAYLVGALLRTCSGVAILATSREPLGIPGETARRVPSLARPDPNVLLDLDQLRRCESVQVGSRHHFGKSVR
jgi:predicted ATPase